MEKKWIRPLQIGNVTLKNNLILAPMAGVTDLPFRLLCAEQGAGLVCSEMISAKAILYNSKNTEELMMIHPQEGPVSLQLFGSDPDIISQMAARIEDRPFSILDINMGCPVPKVVNNGEGSALMKDPLLIGRIVEKTANAIKKPLTIKIRRGFDEEHVNAVEIAHIAQESGAAAVAVHGRTREQFYAGKADWDIIAQVKQAVKIPVLGNGDVKDAQSAGAMFEQTGCDGILIGRGVQGNPWVFAEILQELDPDNAQKEKSPSFCAYPTRQQRYDMILRHAEMMVELKGEYIAIREMRKHVAWYTTGFPHAAKLRGRIMQMETIEQLREGMKELFLA